MEFLANARVNLQASDLQRHIRIDTLPDWCDAVSKVIAHEGERGGIEGPWGECRVHREVIRDGVRFSLPSTAHAIQCTLTVDSPARAGVVVVHCTASGSDTDGQLAQQLEEFAAAWAAGLERGMQDLKATRAAKAAAAGQVCTPWFG